MAGRQQKGGEDREKDCLFHFQKGNGERLITHSEHLMPLAKALSAVLAKAQKGM